MRDLVLAPSLPLLSFFPSPPIIFHLLPARLLPPRGVNTDHLLCLSRLTLSLTPRSRTRREMEMESKNGGKVVRERHRRGRPVRLPYFFPFFFQPTESLTKISFPIDSLLRGHREEIRVRERKGEKETLALASSHRLFAFSPKAKPLLYQPVRAKMTTNLLSFLLCGHPSKNPFALGAGNDISLS